jgi:protein-S-isoprenylcysteine O-methyltransferase Ste14
VQDNNFGEKMALREEFEKKGNWLFRWRSYMPLIMVIILIASLRNFHYLDKSEQMDELWETFCLCVSFFGLAIRIITIGYTPRGTSGRNTKEQIAESLNTKGIYSVVRHPLYLGNFFIWLGIVLFAHQWMLTLVCILSFWLYYERIMFAEEAYLRNKFGKVFENWAEVTPAFIPDLKKWEKADLSFSVRNVLKREYNGFFVIILSMTLLELTGNIFAEGKPQLDMMWNIILGVGFLIWFTLRTLKKKTMLLHVEGR